MSDRYSSESMYARKLGFDQSAPSAIFCATLPVESMM
jgi:hypothetical protein